MKQKIIVLGCLIISGCSNSQNSNPSNGSSLPQPNSNITAGQVYRRAKAEFNISSAPNGAANIQLMKKSYTTDPVCNGGQCTDFSDITVTNTVQTQFAVTPTQSHQTLQFNSQDSNLTNFLNLQIGTLFDNNLVSCIL
jgi:hypothetical protein